MLGIILISDVVKICKFHNISSGFGSEYFSCSFQFFCLGLTHLMQVMHAVCLARAWKSLQLTLTMGDESAKDVIFRSM